MDIYNLYFDGSCGPRNPGGTAAFGFVLERSGEEIPYKTGHGVIGTGEGMTNNLAEFYALAEGLTAFEKSRNYKNYSLVNVYGDSNLVIQVMSDLWKARKDKAYFPAYVRASFMVRTLRRSGVCVNFTWIPREKNTMCDDLSKAHAKKLTKVKTKVGTAQAKVQTE